MVSKDFFPSSLKVVVHTWNSGARLITTEHCKPGTISTLMEPYNKTFLFCSTFKTKTNNIVNRMVYSVVITASHALKRRYILKVVKTIFSIETPYIYFYTRTTILNYTMHRFYINKL